MYRYLADITLPTGGVEGWLKAIFSLAFISIVVACGIIAYLVKKVYDSLPKWVLIALVIAALAAMGIIKFK